MSITQNASRVRIESAAKNGTLGSQSGLNADQIKLDTNISTNNGNLQASPSLKWRNIILRRGEVDEECQSTQSVEGDGVTCNVYNDWDTAPASGDTYDVAYKLDDVATIAGCDYETDSFQWVMSKKLVMATGSVFAYLAMTHGQILRLDDSGALDSAFELNDAARFEIGTIKNDLAERGAQLIFTNDGDGETVMEINNGSVAKFYEFGMHSARSHEGVTGLVVTVGATADVEWARHQSSGMNTPFKNTYKRIEEFDGVILGTVSEVSSMSSLSGWCISPEGTTIEDLLVGKASTDRVRLLIEEG